MISKRNEIESKKKKSWVFSFFFQKKEKEFREVFVDIVRVQLSCVIKVNINFVIYMHYDYYVNYNGLFIK